MESHQLLRLHGFHIQRGNVWLLKDTTNLRSGFLMHHFHGKIRRFCMAKSAKSLQKVRTPGYFEPNPNDHHFWLVKSASLHVPQ